MKRVAGVCALLFSLSVSAQDIHFSHFFDTPLSVNPAFTGYFPGCYRIGVNVRNQWRSITVPYKTLSVYADGNVSDVWKFDKVGIGGILLHDNAGDGRLRTTRAMLSGAVHKGFGEHLVLSFGINGGLTQKKLDFTALIFDDQWTGTSFDPSVTTSEPGTTDPLAYYDVQVGGIAAWNTERDDVFFASISGVHLLTPKESFYELDNQVGVRPVFYGGAYINLPDRFGENLVAEPALFYMRQKRAQEFFIGANVSKLMIGPLDYVTGGLWFRASGDAIPVVGGSYKSVRMLLSYDINVSRLRTASHLRGGFELSLRYIHRCEEPSWELVPPCIRF